MKNTGWKTLIIAVLCAFIALPAVAADKGKAPKFPAEISIGEGPISLNRAVDIAIANSRTLKANELDFESARRKVSETKAQFGFDVKLKGNAVQSHMNSTISMPYTTYDVSAATSSVVLDPSSLQTPTSPVFVITNPYPVIRYNTFSLVKEWSHSSELDVTKMLYTFGKKRDAIKATGGQRDMAKIDVGIGKLDLIENVKKSFFNVLLTQEFVQVQEEAVRQAEAHLSAAKSRFEVGAAPKFDVIRAEVEVATAKENLTTAIKGLDLSKMALNNTIGLPVSRNIKVSDEGAYEKITIQAMEYYLGVADKNRPELMKLKIA
ncbi:MAG: TolC family protein, partial [bacterium]